MIECSLDRSSFLVKPSDIVVETLTILCSSTNFKGARRGWPASVAEPREEERLGLPSTLDIFDEAMPEAFANPSQLLGRSGPGELYAGAIANFAANWVGPRTQAAIGCRTRSLCDFPARKSE